MDPVEIELPTYRILIARGALAEVGRVASATTRAHRYAVIADANVAPLYAARVRSALGEGRTRLYTIPAGEEQKTRANWSTLTDALLGDDFGRDSAIIALGGGVIGDLAGFIAATYMRGIPFIQVPTTLLAMIDASIGGKTGVDTPAGKNLVGAFHDPAAVIADPDVLRTLPTEHLRAGLAEAIKHGVIADASHFDEVVGAAPEILSGSRAAAAALERIVVRSVAIKSDVVKRDKREGGVRKTLNFGHTIGHAIEFRSAYRMLHGEAVAVGMVVESRVAEQLGVAERGTSDRVRAAVETTGLPAARPAEQSPAEILAATRHDKKARAGVVEYALPARIGEMAGADSGWGVPVSDEVVLGALQ
ncbi:MAG TPA: 3-dehydroquinate synthase [Gemmatimonadaceae bacterium]|nr:3-dehydroquinate synthase [Gemmatimonadaceae bacterium]